MTYRIKLWYADGHLGEYTVNAEDSDEAIAKAWGQARRRGLLTLPMAYQRAEILSTSEK